MYETESAAVRVGIEFLQAMTEEDYLLDLSFDVLDLEQKLIEIQGDVVNVFRPKKGRNLSKVLPRQKLYINCKKNCSTFYLPRSQSRRSAV